MRNFIALAIGLMTVLPCVARADSDVRDFEGLAYAPNNMVALFGYFRHTSAADSKVNVNLSQELGGVRGTYVMRFGNLAVVPFDASIFALDYTRYPSITTPLLHGSGFTDPEYFPTIAYIVQEGAATSGMHTVLAFNPRVTIPIGTYDEHNLVNAGQHRVTFKPQIGLAQRFARIFTAELVANVALHSDNSKFVIPSPTMMGSLVTTNMAQAADVYVDAHLAVDLSATFFLGASYYFSKVGAEKLTALNDTQAAPAVTGHSLRFNFGIRVERNTLILLQYDQNVTVKNGPVERFAGFRISHVFFDEAKPSTPQPQHEAAAPPPA